MASHRVGETGLSNSGPSSTHHHHHHHLPYAVLHGMNNNNPSTSFMNQEGPAFDFGELEEAIVLQGVKIRNDEAKASLFTATGRPAATLEMFPSWPIRFQQTPRGSSKSGGESTEDSGSALNTLSSKADALLEPESPISIKVASSSDHHHTFDQNHIQLQHIEMVNETSRLVGGGGGTLQQQQHHHNQSPATAKPSQEKEEPKTTKMADNNDGFIYPYHLDHHYMFQEQQPESHQLQIRNPESAIPYRKGLSSKKPLDAKTLRRLAQNREAAKKSRLRKKVYVQQLETSRIKLSQLEQDLQRARQQGLFLGGCSGAGGNISSGAAIFDMEYARWLEDDHRNMSELRTGLQAHLLDGDLRVIVDGYISHYDEIFRLKCEAAKTDVVHLITGMWCTPAERCFLWMGGFRPSELIKMLISQLDPLTEQQVVGIYSLQHSSQQAEEALSQGLEQLQQSLVDTMAAGPVIGGMQQMAVALGKLANLEGFVRQADNLRQQTLHQLWRILTVRQAARCFLVIGEYYGRLRALSTLWASRPRETLMSDDNSCQTSTDLQMVHQAQQPSHNHFSNFN